MYGKKGAKETEELGSRQQTKGIKVLGNENEIFSYEIGFDSYLLQINIRYKWHFTSTEQKKMECKQLFEEPRLKIHTIPHLICAIMWFTWKL